MRKCRCIKKGLGGFHIGWQYPFEENSDGSFTVDDGPAFSFRFKNKSDFSAEFVEVDTMGNALISDNMMWKTESVRELPVVNMTTEHIINCLKWVGFSAEMGDTKDGYTVREWLHSFSLELEKRNSEEK